MSKVEDSPSSENPEQSGMGRRELLKALAAATGYVAIRVAIPAAWSAPLIMSMPLPAHAQTSGQTAQAQKQEVICGTGDTEPPNTSTKNAEATIAAAVSGTTVTLTVSVPSALTDARTIFRVVERVGCAGGETSKQLNVVTTVLPSTGRDLSGRLTHRVTRTAGTYEFQLRWTGGYSDWATATVVAR